MSVGSSAASDRPLKGSHGSAAGQLPSQSFASLEKRGAEKGPAWEVARSKQRTYPSEAVMQPNVIDMERGWSHYQSAPAIRYY